MKKPTKSVIPSMALVAISLPSLTLSLPWAGTNPSTLAHHQQDGFQMKFDVNSKDLETTGSNPYFPLTPGLKLEFSGGDEQLVFTILKETQVIDGVKCRVIEERSTKSGKLIEISRNFFVTDKKTKDVYYFGEDVDNYKDGKIINHGSAWRSGVNGAKFGLHMPGKPKVGFKFYQEQAPKVALDRINITKIDETVTVPAGQFNHCVIFEETTPLEAGVTEYKKFAFGVGMVQDAELKLVKKSMK